MKKISLSLIAIALAINFSYAQWTASGNNIYNTNTGNVGIGTATPPTIGSYGVLALNGSNPYQGGYLSLMTNGAEVGSIIANSQLGIAAASGLITQFYTGSSPTMQISSSGKVGIGTTSPTQLLEVNGGYALLNGLRINGGDVPNSIYSDSDIGITTNGGAAGLHLLQTGNQYFTGGNVGIGTPNPAYKLDVNGGIHAAGISEFGSGYFHVSTDQNFGSGASYTFRDAVGINNPNGSSFASGTTVVSIGAMSNGVSLITTGNVGVGTANPDQKLTVKGSIHSQEVIVDMNVMPDYVFKPAYRLPSLTEVKTYIDQNHHLPEMPSAEQVAKAGLSLGDMNAKLLKKVEELTLYLIEKDKENKEIHKELDELKKQISTLIKPKP